MADHVYIKESVLLDMKKKDLVSEIKIRQNQVKVNNTEILYISKQAPEVKASKYPKH